MPPSISPSAIPTSSGASLQPRTLCSTIFHRWTHLERERERLYKGSKYYNKRRENGGESNINIYIPVLTRVSPKKRIMRQRSEPKPVLSGQFTVITLGSSSLSGCLIITASSYSIPISFLLLSRGGRRRRRFN